MKIIRAKYLRSCWLNLSAFWLMAAMCGYANADSTPLTFSSPEEAVKTLVAAIKESDKDSLMKILGPDAKKILESDDLNLYRANRARFLEAYENGHTLVKSGDTKVFLEVGDWQFPIPVVKQDNSDSWYFDMEAGWEEMQNRHIGRNELSTIQAVLAYVDAQTEYYLANPQQDKIPTYAQKFLSTKNLRDGLYYPVKEGEKPSPLGELYAQAQASGRLKEQDEKTKRRPYYGYFFRILHGQGPDAKGGAYDYVVNKKMFGGHALIAWPENYDSSGVKTFIVNHDGVVYERDLGPDTATAVEKIRVFNPDENWNAVSEEDKTP